MAAMTFEILIPVRNPTDVFVKTIESLVVQTDRNFSVLISDNFSTSGQEYIEKALAALASAGIRARRIQPPGEVGRVEHWNWIHYQSGAAWLKPLFAGDWLDTAYIQMVREVMKKEPRCGYFYCNYQHHQGAEILEGQSRWRTDCFHTPAEAQNIVLRYGMQFGPPSTAIYRRDLFFRCGGYDPALPICADSLFFCILAARFGTYGISRTGTHFFIHGARFSDTLAGKQRQTLRETLRYYGQLGLCAWQENWRFPKLGYLRMIARELYHRRKSR